MTVYFCLDDVFEVLVQRNQADASFDDLIPVSTKIMDCSGYREDALTLASRPQLLDLTDPKCCYQMADLIDEIPLYQINLVMLLDDVLSRRHHNQIVLQAITDAFEGQVLPPTIKEEGSTIPENTLLHPALGKMSNVDLCKIYLGFMQALPRGHDDFSFERYILGNHSKPYHEQFDGFVSGDTGKVKAAILIGFGTRTDFDPRLPMEGYIENGRRAAAAMRITEPHELVWAWLEADHYQMRRCHDIDRLLTLRGLPRMPNWVRTDVFHCLEREATKQVLAAKLLEVDPDLKILTNKPAILRAMQLSATGQNDENLEQLLHKVLNPGALYTGAAEKFFAGANQRQRESRDI